jgi:glutamate dehydrogenase (NADP+)
MIAYAGQGSFKGKKVAISGSGNVAQYAAIKAMELGASVVSLSDSKGSLFAPKAYLSHRKTSRRLQHSN